MSNNGAPAQAPCAEGERPMIQLNVNGRDQQVDADPDTPLLRALRDTLGLTGTKYGCGIAQCGEGAGGCCERF
jgi:xanthine dehydrogenase iron-sulfur cluster and FAD-binding subunit A